MADDKMKALQELLRVLSDQPDVADLIEIKIRPGKLKQGAENTEE